VQVPCRDRGDQIIARWPVHLQCRLAVIELQIAENIDDVGWHHIRIEPIDVELVWVGTLLGIGGSPDRWPRQRPDGHDDLEKLTLLFEIVILYGALAACLWPGDDLHVAGAARAAHECARNLAGDIEDLGLGRNKTGDVLHDQRRVGTGFAQVGDLGHGILAFEDGDAAAIGTLQVASIANMDFRRSRIGSAAKKNDSEDRADFRLCHFIPSLYQIPVAPALRHLDDLLLGGEGVENLAGFFVLLAQR